MFSFQFKGEKYDAINVLFNKYEDGLFSSFTYKLVLLTTQKLEMSNLS